MLFSFGCIMFKVETLLTVPAFKGCILRGPEVPSKRVASTEHSNSTGCSSLGTKTNLTVVLMQKALTSTRIFSSAYKLCILRGQTGDCSEHTYRICLYLKSLRRAVRALRSCASKCYRLRLNPLLDCRLRKGAAHCCKAA